MTLVLATVSGAFAQAAPRDIAAACPETRVTSAGFGDTAGTTFATEIDCVVWWGIASGRSATTFGPDQATNRAQMASFFANLIREAGGELPDGPPRAFADISGSVHADNINALAAIGVVAGTTATTYSPSRSVTREQMATFIFRTYRYLTGEELIGDQDYFADDAGSVHEVAINAIAQVGITGGDASGNFRPGGDVSRGAMTAFLARMLDLLIDTGFASPPPLPDAVLGTDLSRVSRSNPNAALDTCDGFSTRTVSISGQVYEDSRRCSLDWSSDNGWEEYDLGRDYGRFRAKVGQTDTSENTTSTVRFTVYGDGATLFSQVLSFGQAVDVDVDVSGVLRLRLEVAVVERDGSSGRYTDAAWGRPTVGG